MEFSMILGTTGFLIGICFAFIYLHYLEESSPERIRLRLLINEIVQGDGIRIIVNHGIESDISKIKLVEIFSHYETSGTYTGSKFQMFRNPEGDIFFKSSRYSGWLRPVMIERGSVFRVTDEVFKHLPHRPSRVYQINPASPAEAKMMYEAEEKAYSEFKIIGSLLKNCFQSIKLEKKNFEDSYSTTPCSAIEKASIRLTPFIKLGCGDGFFVMNLVNRSGLFKIEIEVTDSMSNRGECIESFGIDQDVAIKAFKEVKPLSGNSNYREESIFEEAIDDCLKPIGFKLSSFVSIARDFIFKRRMSDHIARIYSKN